MDTIGRPEYWFGNFEEKKFNYVLGYYNVL